MNESTLICTLGGQPQIITFALDYLLARAETVREVFALHLSPDDQRINHALKCLSAEFVADSYRGQRRRFRAKLLRQNGRPLTHIRTEAEAEAVRQTVFSLVTELKQAGRTLHLCIAGGPRMMGLMTLSAAMLHCGHEDKIWHMYTEPAFRKQANEGAIMHDDTGQRVRLIQAPIVPWGAYLPPLISRHQTPTEAIAAQTTWLDEEEEKRRKAVWQILTRRQKDVLYAFAQGLSPQDVAEHLVVSIKTVDSHKTRILAECKIAWHIPEANWLDYHFLREHFRTILHNPYYTPPSKTLNQK